MQCPSRFARRTLAGSIVALTLAGCAADDPGLGRFRIAGSLAADILPGTGQGPVLCNDYHRSLSGRTPAAQQAALARITGGPVDRERAVRHAQAAEQLCAPAPSGD